MSEMIAWLMGMPYWHFMAFVPLVILFSLLIPFLINILSEEGALLPVLYWLTGLIAVSIYFYR